MSARQLLLLSPYRLPTESTLYLADEEVAAFLNGHAALWHPAALKLAAGSLPQVASPYDHEEPGPGHVYAVPDNPPSLLPDDWEQKARAAGAVVFQATADHEQTLANLLDALPSATPTPPPGEGEESPPPPDLSRLAALPRERVAPFLGFGFAYAQLEALFEAMSHENVLATSEVGDDLLAAVDALEREDADAFREHLQSAADRLLSAREVVYAVSVYVVDLALADESRPDAPWPAASALGQAWNLLAPARLLERLGKDHPERLAALREQVAAGVAEVVGGGYAEREDTLLPPESQLWNLLRGQAVYQELLGQEVRVFARRRFGFQASTPLLLQNTGFSHALLVSFDEAVLPSHRSAVVSWPSPDGKQVDAFTRAPLPADSPQTYFHLAHHLHQTIMQDQAASLALVHRDRPAPPWYRDWLELSRFAPVLGRWYTYSGYFSEVLAGDYTSAASPDEFNGDHLQERCLPAEDAPPAAHFPTAHPVSGFAAQARDRRRVDAAWTLAALLRGLGGKVEDRDGQPFETFLARLEDRFESGQELTPGELESAQHAAAEALARRLVARGQADNPGFLVLNPCSFTRRVALDLPGAHAPVAVGGPVKACQVDGDAARVVVEVPGLGFAWVPGAPAPPPPTSRIRLADERCVRNEFLEAEVDPQTGGLRAVRDLRTRRPRLGQMLVYNPGSTMRARQVTVTSSGPAYGEVVSEGVLLDEQGQELAGFRQRFRAWLGRPMLDLRVELTPARPPEGYPWHAYYGARFAWRDEGATLLRGVFGTASPTSHTRPETPDFLEVRLGRQNAVIFPGGLPFHQRHGGRMVDVLLVAPGEACRAFDLGISLDREHPAQTALGVVSPAPVVPLNQGPPHVGATGWLFHLDSPNLLLTSLRPVDDPPAISARLLETSGFGGPAELRCVRDPQRALVLDARGSVVMDALTQGDGVQLEVSANDLLQLRVEFG